MSEGTATNLRSSSDLRLIMIGPMPPPIGGTTVSFSALCRFLSPRLRDCIVIDTVRRSGGTLLTGLSTIIRLLKNLHRADVVAMHFSDGAATSIAPLIWWLSRLAGKPCVFRQFGGEFARTFFGLPRWRQKLVAGTILRSDAVFLQTKGMMNDFRQFSEALHWFPTARNRLQHSYSGRFAQGQNSTLRCMFLGHVSKAKGIERAIAAVKEIPNAELAIFGPLIDVSEQDLAVARVRYHGVVAPELVGGTMANYDVLLFPTNYPGEGYSGTLVEAAMVGLPIIATRWQSLPEMFSEEEVIFVDPSQPQQLADALRNIVAQPNLLLQRSQRLSDRASDFDASRVFERFLRICTELASKGKS